MNDAFLHAFNIALHVATGLAVLLLGLWQLAAPHGDKAHRRRGRWVLALAGVSVASAAVGALVQLVGHQQADGLQIRFGLKHG